MIYLRDDLTICLSRNICKYWKKNNAYQKLKGEKKRLPQK